MTGLRCFALVTDAYGGHGGIAQYNRDFCGALAEDGATITVAPRHAPQRAPALPTGVKQIPARRGKIAYTLSALGTALRGKIDVVFCGHIHLAPLASLVASIKGAQLIVQMHGIEAWARPSPLQRYALERTDLVLCVSRYTRARVLGWAAIVPERALVVPNTVGETFTPGDGSALRGGLHLNDERVLLTVGRMDARERYKGHDRVLEALPTLLAQGHRVVYLIVGEGNDRGRLAALANKHGVANQIRFVSGVDTKSLVDAYRIADLFVMPSTGEGFGIAFLEAMASGTAALGLAVAGAWDALADGELGAAILKTDNLATAISSLLSEPKPDPNQLSTATLARFGREAFVARVGTALERCRQAA
jgi:phosphatidylinositol alpha-1,6-mannosyltransferase